MADQVVTADIVEQVADRILHHNGAFKGNSSVDVI